MRRCAALHRLHPLQVLHRCNHHEVLPHAYALSVRHSSVPGCSASRVSPSVRASRRPLSSSASPRLRTTPPLPVPAAATVQSRSPRSPRPARARRAAAAPAFRHSPMASPAPASAASPIAVTAEEAALFSKVLEAVNAERLACTVRVAGGWVRDKLLGLSSDDVDFVLDTVTGREFAEAIDRHLRARGEGRTSTIATIRLNPSQSKHLETSTFRLDGFSIDANRFRDEVYSEDSRIPHSVQPSNALEDALRRDFTINALFYNVHTTQVEDLVGGVADLSARVVRTPRAAAKTFRDDPLRVLRAARFAARFGFDVDVAVDEAAAGAEVHADLRKKVTRERVGIELQKVMDRPRTATRGMSLLSGWGLRQAVFDVRGLTVVRDERVEAALRLWPVELSAEQKESADVTAECLRCMRAMHGLLFSTPFDDRSDAAVHGPPIITQATSQGTVSSADASRLLLFSYLVPYFGYRVDSIVKEKKAAGGSRGSGDAGVPRGTLVSVRVKDRYASLQSVLLRESHVHAADAALCQRLMDAAAALCRLSRAFAALPSLSDPAYAQRHCALVVASGLALRSVDAAAVQPLLLLTTVFESSLNAGAADVEAFMRHLREETPLFRCAVWAVQELMDGTQLQSALHTPPGPHLSKLKERMLEWQIEHLQQLSSGQLTKEDALAHLRSGLAVDRR